MTVNKYTQSSVSTRVTPTQPTLLTEPTMHQKHLRKKCICPKCVHTFSLPLLPKQHKQPFNSISLVSGIINNLEMISIIQEDRGNFCAIMTSFYINTWASADFGIHEGPRILPHRQGWYLKNWTLNRSHSSRMVEPGFESKHPPWSLQSCSLLLCFSSWNGVRNGRSCKWQLTLMEPKPLVLRLYIKWQTGSHSRKKGPPLLHSCKGPVEMFPWSYSLHPGQAFLTSHFIPLIMTG
jgi:hypothetical protein